MGIPGGKERERGTENLVKEITDGTFPSLGKELDIQVQQANRTRNYLNAKRPSLRHIILKLSKVNKNKKQ